MQVINSPRQDRALDIFVKELRATFLLYSTDIHAKFEEMLGRLSSARSVPDFILRRV